jgi:general stress protein YciG
MTPAHQPSSVSISEKAQSHPRGFAAMSPERVRAISRLGGKAAHEKGVAHQFTPEEARVAGRKGGLAAQSRRAHSTDTSPQANLDQDVRLAK